MPHTIKVTSSFANGPEKPWLSSAIRKHERVNVHVVAEARPAHKAVSKKLLGQSCAIGLQRALTWTDVPKRNPFHTLVSLSSSVSLAKSHLPLLRTLNANSTARQMNISSDVTCVASPAMITLIPVCI